MASHGGLAWRWYVRLLLVIAGLVVGVIAVEIGLRSLGFPSRVLEFSPSGIPGYFFMKPNQDYIEQGFYAAQPPHRIRINSLGVRGPEVDSGRSWR